MAPETLEQISTLVRSGFYPKEILTEIICQEMYAPGELDPAEVSSVLDTEFQKLSTEQAGWPDVTDCDRLDTVFAALNGRGIVAIQILLPVDCYARNHLHKIQIISSVKRHINDLLGSDGHAYR